MAIYSKVIDWLICQLYSKVIAIGWKFRVVAVYNSEFFTEILHKRYVINFYLWKSAMESIYNRKVSCNGRVQWRVVAMEYNSRVQWNAVTIEHNGIV